MSAAQHPLPPVVDADGPVRLADVYRTWHTNGRGTERLSSLQGLVDLLPFGRQEEWEDSPEGWPQHPTYAEGMGSKEIGELYGTKR